MKSWNPKKLKKPFPVPRSSSKEPSSQTFERRARPNSRRRRAARRRQPDYRRYGWSWRCFNGLGYEPESSRCVEETLGLTTKDADFSAVWLTRDQFGMTFLDQLGLMDMGDLLELSKGLSKIGAKIFEGVWFKLRTWKSPVSFLDKHAPGCGA